MTATLSRAPWWRVALGFLLAPLVVLPITIPVLPEHFWSAVLVALGWSYAITGLLCLPAYLFLRRNRQLGILPTAFAGGVIYAVPVIAFFVGVGLENLTLTGHIEGDGDISDLYFDVSVMTYALIAGIVGSAIFWLIVYGWRTPATRTRFRPPAARELKVVKQGDGYLVDATSSDADSNWRTEQPMSDTSIIKELLSRGYHQTDIGDAFEAADPGWISRKSSQ